MATGKQNLTIRLDREIIQKARALAASRQSSVSTLVAEQIEAMAGQKTAYERAKKRALHYLKSGIEMGPIEPIPRDELHERAHLR